MNDILQRQATGHFVNMLAAARQLYDDYKHQMTYWWVASLTLAFLAAGIIPLLVPFKSYLSFLGFVVAGTEFLVLYLVGMNQKNAARIQEQYDHELLEIPWNDALTMHPQPQLIVDAAGRHLTNLPEDKLEELRTWYPATVGEMPMREARIVCQRTNIWWDSALRRMYALRMFIAIFCIVVIGGLISIASDWTFQQIVAGPALAVAPVLFLSIKNVHAHYLAANRLDELSAFAEQLSQQAADSTVADEMILRDTRHLQDGIFHNRSSNPSVPTWFHKLYRDKFENIANDPDAFS